MTFGKGPDTTGFDYEADFEDLEFDFPISAGFSSSNPSAISLRLGRHLQCIERECLASLRVFVDDFDCYRLVSSDDVIIERAVTPL